MRIAAAFVLLNLGIASVALAAGDLTKQAPIEVHVALGTATGQHKFVPADITFETGKLYKLILTNPSRTALLYVTRICFEGLHAQGPGRKAGR